MVLRVKLHGAGKPGDPYRVNLPTYDLFWGDIEEGWAVVRVPDDAHPLTAEDRTRATVKQTTNGDVVTGLPADLRKKFDAYLKEHYSSDKKHALELA